MKDRIIVLKVQKYSDAHLIVTGMNPLGAKFSAMAPAALKSRKRFGGGVLEPTHFIEIQYEKAKSEGQLPILKEAVLIDGFEGLRAHFDKLNLGFYFLKLVEAIAQEEPMDSQSLYSLLGHSLKALELATDLPSFRKHFEMKFLYTQGLLEITEEVAPYLKKRLADNILVPSQFEESQVFQKIRQTLSEYVGAVDSNFQF
jgi:DNA repair protein RecO (recombination protein O)